MDASGKSKERYVAVCCREEKTVQKRVKNSKDGRKVEWERKGKEGGCRLDRKEICRREEVKQG